MTILWKTGTGSPPSVSDTFLMGLVQERHQWATRAILESALPRPAVKEGLNCVNFLTDLTANSNLPMANSYKFSHLLRRILQIRTSFNQWVSILHTRILITLLQRWPRWTPGLYNCHSGRLSRAHSRRRSPLESLHSIVTSIRSRLVSQRLCLPRWMMVLTVTMWSWD